ncbi:DEAD/DEAH box helicase [Acidovorax sp. sic0104]|uniref:DEAD/DEAH box helicase n=1 Tax=Acidovorax sp. sic0104 TaxID=2854784 RepID=UPI001C4449B1|nr:DEAD/DEAH box helicase [Acidovorax sp. sic0104]MBV7541851.1 DEAD/DEAH box helicase [Acidovorax sp. sic0104]
MQAQCDSGAWSRGLALFRSAEVVRIAVAPAAGGAWRIEGEVQGSQSVPYEVVVKLALAPNGQVKSWAGDCTCPVGADCKHAVALTLEAAERNPAHAAASPQAAQVLQSMQERKNAAARAQADARLAHWLQDWDRAVGASGPPAPGAQGARPERADRPECYLYLVSTVGRPRGTVPQMQLEAVVSYPKVTGGWAKPKQIRTQPGPGQAVYDSASDADHQVLQLLRAMPRSVGYYSAYSVAPIGLLEGAVGLLALKQAAATSRLFVDAGGSTVGPALRWGEPLAIAWVWKESVPAMGADSLWSLQATLPSPTATLCDNQPALYVDATRGECGPVHAEGLSPAQVGMLLKAPALNATSLQKRHAEVASRLGGVLPLPPVLGPLTRVQGVKPVARLHLAPVQAQNVAHLGLVAAQLQFDYQGHVGWWGGQDPGVLLTGADGGQVLLRRDAAAELDAIERLMALGLLATDEGVFGIPGGRSQNDWMHWADNGFAVLRDAGFAVTTDAALDGWISHADMLDVSLQPEGGDDSTSPWFALSLGIDIDGVRHNILPWLPDLIAAAAAQPPDPASGQPRLPSHVYLASLTGSGFVRLPTTALQPWMAALLDLVGDRTHDFQRDSLKLSRLEVLRTTAALGEGVPWEGAAALRGVVAQLQGAGVLPEVPLPASVHATLRPYQQQGLNWLQFLRAHGLAGVLADDMGLGKTLQTLAHIQVEKDAGRLTEPALVIAPVSLLGNWQREAARFCPGLRCLVLHGAGRHDAADRLAEHDLVIAPYSLLQRDRERWLAQAWHLVVLDEAQNIKNASSKAAQVAGGLNARHRLCLSGTPMENHLGEVWSLFHFLMPGFLGSEQRFKALFRTPIEKQGDTARMEQLRARTTPFMLRRTKALVAGELPPKVESVMPVPLAGPQADLYETIRLGMEKSVREALQSQGLAKSQITILDALLKLRQVCCHPQLVPLDAARAVSTSAKLDQLMAMLPEMLAEGRRVLLFSQFTSMLTLIEAELRRQGLPWAKLTGQSQKRDAIIEKFTSGQVPLFLISLKAGGVGLNLPQADTVIHFDPWWNPAVENQATDRAHRIGQTQSVWVIKLVAQGTIEERILALQEKKAQLAGSLYGGAAARKEPLFTQGDLDHLLAPLSP